VTQASHSRLPTLRGSNERIGFGATLTYTLARVKPFRTSARFGLIGVLVVAALTVVVGLTMGQGEAKPKDAYALIFAILGVYLVLLFILQLRDVSKAEGVDARAMELAPAEIENPATVDEATLWAAMAVGPIDDDAIRARKQTWGTARSSIHLGILICALIFLTVPPIYLLDTFVPLFIGVPLIAGIALWKSVRLLGGGLDRAYEGASRAMAPLGLEVVEHPEVTIRPKGVAPYRMGPDLQGALVLEGDRHGRHVAVRMPATGGVRSPSQVRLALTAPEFDFKVRDGRLKAGKGAPDEVAALLKGVPNSTRWNGVRGAMADGALEIDRGHAWNGDWLLDLWLAERLAETVGR
jgi:hypothetical protein